jgi:hypothetical protein
VRYGVGGLKESRLASLREVRNVAQVVDRSAARAQLPEAPHPDPRTLFVRALREDDQPSLWITVVLIPPRQQDVETTADFLGRVLDRLFAARPLVLLDDRDEEDDAGLVRVRDGHRHVQQDRLALVLLDASPESRPDRISAA